MQWILSGMFRTGLVETEARGGGNDGKRWDRDHLKEILYWPSVPNEGYRSAHVGLELSLG